MKKYLLFAVLSIVTTSPAMAGVCGNSWMEKVNSGIDSAVPDICSAIDTNPSLENNPFSYENPQATCDLGLSLEGMPDFDGFGFDVSGANACKVAQMVTGDMVAEINTKVDDFATTTGSYANDFSTVLDLDLEAAIDGIVNGDGVSNGVSTD